MKPNETGTTVLIIMAVMMCVTLGVTVGTVLYVSRVLMPATAAVVIAQPAPSSAASVLLPTFTSTPTNTLEPTDTPKPTALPTLTSTPTNTPEPTSTQKPTALPTATSQPTTLVVPTLTAVPRFKGTETEFKAYLRQKYSTIAGNALEIEDIFILNEPSRKARVVDIELTRDSALYTFGEQTRVDATSYGTNLLRDTIAFFGGEDCAAYVSSSWYSRSLSDYYFKEWYYIGDWHSGKGWYISKDYIKAYLTGGNEKVKVWNFR